MLSALCVSDSIVIKLSSAAAVWALTGRTAPEQTNRAATDKSLAVQVVITVLKRKKH
jgi:hypothetical protein